jgi:hypothetical protein
MQALGADAASPGAEDALRVAAPTKRASSALARHRAAQQQAAREYDTGTRAAREKGPVDLPPLGRGGIAKSYAATVRPPSVAPALLTTSDNLHVGLETGSDVACTTEDVPGCDDAGPPDAQSDATLGPRLHEDIAAAERVRWEQRMLLTRELVSAGPELAKITPSAHGQLPGKFTRAVATCPLPFLVVIATVMFTFAGTGICGEKFPFDMGEACAIPEVSTAVDDFRTRGTTISLAENSAQVFRAAAQLTDKVPQDCEKVANGNAVVDACGDCKKSCGLCPGQTQCSEAMWRGQVPSLYTYTLYTYSYGRRQVLPHCLCAC